MKGFCVWITGLSGAGKTTLAKELITCLNRSVTFIDGDEIRTTLCKDLGFTKKDRDTNIARIAFVANEVVKQGGIVVVACISPYKEARNAAKELIGNIIEVYLDTPQEIRKERGGFSGVYEISSPEVTFSGGVPKANALMVIDYLIERGYLGVSFMLGRYQPWHDGHTALFREALKEGRVLIGLRPDKHYGFDEVEARIDAALAEYKGRYSIMRMPNITNIIYGRTVGYKVTRAELPAEVESISATKIRAATA